MTASTRGAGWLVLALALVAAVAAAEQPVLSVLPELDLDPAVPSVRAVAGFDWGEEIGEPGELHAYARALAAAAPARVRAVEIGRSIEGRPLTLLVISSEATMSRLDEVRERLARLADPRRAPGDAEAALGGTPAVVWVACSVHGDEASGADAGLALAYALAAGRSAAVREILDATIVVIDPLQNPDGRARFVAATRQARGASPDAEPASAEHQQPWPGGRVSHDLFDLNRDWFALTHPESAARVAAMLAWHPTVVMDLHEMGAEMRYFFAPPAAPRHPLVSTEQAGLWDLVGRGNAAAFDAHGWRYWTRELFDAFYPGYGESWPFFSGALGMTYEQASPRGLRTRLEDGSILTHAEAIRRHLVAAFTTCRTVARAPERFLRSWAAYRAVAVREGREAPRAYLLEAGADGLRAAALAELLARQGLEVHRAADGRGYVVPLEQPLARLARTLLAPRVEIGEAFAREQERRDARRQPDEIYDLTAWSLPLLWGTGLRELARPVALGERVEAGRMPAGRVSGQGDLAFVLAWTSPAAAQAAGRLLAAGVRLEVARRPFSIAGRRFERGAIVIHRADNPEGLRSKLDRVVAETGVEMLATASGYAEEGIDLGSTNVIPLKPPRIALAWDRPVSPTGAGHVRWALERFFHLPVSAVRTATLARTDLSRFDVIVLPSGEAEGYGAVLGEEGGRRLAAWTRAGGVLIAVGDAARYLTEEKLQLLASKAERRGGEPPAEPGQPAAAAPSPKPASAGFDYDRQVTPADERPPMVPGAILRATLDPEHLLAAGFPSGGLDVLVNSRRIFLPLKLDQGTNIAVYAGADELVRSGFVLAASRAQLPRKAYMMAQPHGRGLVVAFAEDPAMRGFTRDSMLLLANAVLFGAVAEDR